MIGERETDCAIARRFLDLPDPSRAPHIADHLADCPACQAVFEKNPEILQAVFAEAAPLPPVQVIAEANRRIQQDAPHPLPEDQTLLPTPFAPGFALEKPIRRTLHSQVYLATQVGLDRQVVVKFVSCPASLFDFQLLVREGNILGALKHPNILTVYQTGRWANGVWMALEYCPKGSLHQCLESGRRPTPRASAQIVRKLALAVTAAHRIGIIHNDIKPGNILIGDDGEPRLADFGLARNLGEKWRDSPDQPLIGTPAYMAPEQVRRGLPDIRTDVHALGAVLYQLLTGKLPFIGDSPFQTMLEVAHTVPTPPDQVAPGIPADLAAICMKCLAKAPEHRFQNPRGLARDLNRFLRDRPIRARQWTRLETLIHWTRRNQATATALAATALILVGSTAILASMGWKTYQAMEKSQANEVLALQYLEKAESQAYASSIQAAAFEVEGGSTAAATDLLNLLPFNRRGWEHHHITGRLRQNQVTLLDHGGPVLALAIRPDGQEWVSTSSDRSVRLWDGATATQLKNLLGGSYPFVNAVYSPDGSRLAVVDTSNRVRLLDTRSKTRFPEIQLPQIIKRGEELQPQPLALSLDGSLLYAQDNDNRITEWQVESGALLRVFDLGHQGRIHAMALSPDGLSLVTAGEDKRIVVWDPATGQPAREIRGHEKSIRCLAFSPDGKTLASAGKGKRIKLWRFESGKHLFTLDGHQDWINSLAFNPTGTILASASDDHTIRLWNAWEGRPLRTFRGHNDTVNAVRFSPDGKRLVSASSDNTIKLWNPAASQGLKELRHSDWVRSVAISPDGALLATLADDNQLRLWSTRTGEVLKRAPISAARPGNLCFSPNGDRLAVSGASNSFFVFSVKPWTLEKTVTSHSGPINDLVFTPDGTGLCTASEDNTITRWDTRDWRPVKNLELKESVLRAIAISPDGHCLAVGGEGKAIHLVDTTAWTVRQVLEGDHDKMRDMAFSPDGKLLATGGHDRVIRLWDLQTGAIKKQLEGHSMAVTSIQFSPDGTRLLSSSFDRTIRLWDPAAGRELISLNNHHANVRKATFSPDGQWIASAGDDNRVLLWDGSARLEEYKVRQFKSLADLKEVVDSHNRSAAGDKNSWGSVNQLLGPVNNKGWSISRDGPDYIILDRQTRATRLAREQETLNTWK